MPQLRIHRFDSEHDFLEYASKEVLSVITDTLTQHETCRIGLSGGSTPKALYRRLSELHIPWDRLTLIIIDERFVPISDKQSNYGMIHDELFANINIPKENIIFFDTSLGYDSAVLATEQKLLQLKIQREPLFDLLILGAGPDGHIAGIFPDTDTASQKGFLTAKTQTDIFQVRDRLTCTMEALTSCGKALLLLRGHEKSHILHGIEQGNISTPVGKFIKAVPAQIFAIEIGS